MRLFLVALELFCPRYDELALRPCEENGPVWVEPTWTQALSWGLTSAAWSPAPMCQALRDVG